MIQHRLPRRPLNHNQEIQQTILLRSNEFFSSREGSKSLPIFPDGGFAMNLTCKHCKETIPAANINMAKTLALCPRCHTVFNFSPEFEASKPIYRDVNRPIGYTIEADGYELHIGYTWRKGSLLFAIIAVAVVDFLIWWWFADAFNHQRTDQALFGLIFLTIGIPATYGLLLMIFNRTDIRIKNNQLTVQNGPLPVWGNRTLEADQIEQVYVREFKHGARNRVRFSYRVQAVLRNQSDMVLIDNLDDPNEGFYIEQQLERYLRIRDVRIAGEYAGS